ncbi:MAG: alpha/beta hydrolase [Verrucomicrobia bacterium]|nr:alpha/beta hydrolase [Verrucomicrobiota bacterium]
MLGQLHAGVQPAPEPKVELLWPQGAPGAVGSEDADKPTLTIWLPPAAKANGAAVVICPGGGYGHLAVKHEGADIAAWLNARGVAAFMLKYRLGPRYHHPSPMLDVQRAVRTVRTRAAEWSVDPKRIGVWGFSAGGHLASTAGTHFGGGNAGSSDKIERASCRPDFMILAYPVISMETGVTHGGSRNNLLGKEPDPKLVELMSNEKQVTKRTPPAFLFHTRDDQAVPVENAVRFHDALQKAEVPAEIQLYDHGKHGVGLAPNDPVLCTWPDRLEAWLKARGVLAAKQPAKP